LSFMPRVHGGYVGEHTRTSIVQRLPRSDVNDPCIIARHGQCPRAECDQPPHVMSNVGCPDMSRFRDLNLSPQLHERAASSPHALRRRRNRHLLNPLLKHVRPSRTHVQQTQLAGWDQIEELVLRQLVWRFGIKRREYSTEKCANHCACHLLADASLLPVPKRHQLEPVLHLL